MKEYYEKYWTRDSDVSNHDVTTPERKHRLLQTLNKYCKPGETVLDLGCGGGGKFTAWSKAAGFEAIGMDISKKAVAMAQREYPDGNFKTLNTDGSIPAADKTFGAVWCSEVIEHIMEVDDFLKEVRRVMKPGGILIITTPYHGFIKNLFIVLFKFHRHFNVLGSHIRFFDKHSLASSFERTRFTPLSYGGIGRFWPMYRTWFVVARKEE